MIFTESWIYDKIVSHYNNNGSIILHSLELRPRVAGPYTYFKSTEYNFPLRLLTAVTSTNLLNIWNRKP